MLLFADDVTVLSERDRRQQQQRATGTKRKRTESAPEQRKVQKVCTIFS